MLSCRLIKLVVFLAILGGTISRPTTSGFNNAVDHNAAEPSVPNKTNDPVNLPNKQTQRQDTSKTETTPGGNGDKSVDSNVPVTIANPAEAPAGVNNALDQNAVNSPVSDKTNDPQSPQRRDTSKVETAPAGNGDKSVDSNVPVRMSNPAEAPGVNNALDQNAVNPPVSDKTNEPVTVPNKPPNHGRDTSKVETVPGGSGDKTVDSNVPATIAKPAEAPGVNNVLDQNAVEPSGSEKTNNPTTTTTTTAPSTQPHRRDTSPVGATLAGSADKTNDSSNSNDSKL